MKRYWNYLKYIVRHKWYVTIECFKESLIWRGIIHDWDKFLPSCFIAYAKFFHDKDGSSKTKRDKTGYYKPTETGNEAFEYAWFKHTRYNDHHWQHWVLATEGKNKAYRMKLDAIIEMVCDWKGAGKAQDTPDTVKWWKANNKKMQLHPGTREVILLLLGIKEV